MSYIYLASPYTHDDDAIIQHRFELNCSLVGELTRRGQLIYSPIVHFHLPARMCNLPKVFDFWREANVTMLRHAKGLFVYELPGWEQSKGVMAEIQLAQQLGLPITFLEEVPKWKETKID